MKSAAVAWLFMVVAASVFAQAYPTKPIRLVVSYTAINDLDKYARAVQEPLARLLGQPVVIDNKIANGMLAAEAVAQSAPDGYTLLLGNVAPLAMVPTVPFRYDPLADFTPIVRAADTRLVLLVHPSLPVQNVAELIAHAKDNPGKLSYGSGGSGKELHLYMELFRKQSGTDMRHVPYWGASEFVNDILGGNVQVVLAHQGWSAKHVQSGKLHALAVAASRRSALVPDLPTIAEAGLAGYDATWWQGVVGPRGLPPEIVKRLNEAFNEAMAMPAVREKLLADGLEPVGGTPEEFRRFLADEVVKWRKVAAELGVKAQ